MSSLTDNEKRYFEKLLGMESGYVLDYSDVTFGELFTSHGIDIHGKKYQIYGTSKAKKMRAFWLQESDVLVGKILSEMLDTYKTNCDLSDKEFNESLFNETKNIVERLFGKSTKEISNPTIDDFMHREFIIPNIMSLPIEASVVPIIETRLEEARRALSAGAHLSVIFLCGSVLEGVLFGTAQKYPAKFNCSSASPKDKEGKVKPFLNWTLAQLIEVSFETGLLKQDIKIFSHGLRDFRNYIHPYQQIVSGFTPDEHTAKVCFQVLKSALASVSGDRK
jgi:hypothetical protein